MNISPSCSIGWASNSQIEPPFRIGSALDESPDRSANSGTAADFRRALAQKDELPTLTDLQRLI